MKRLISFFFWSFLFLVVCLGLDQLLVRVEMPLPVLTEVRTFYVDLRNRMLQLGHRLPAKRGGVEKKASPQLKSAPAQPKAAVPAISPQQKASAPARPRPIPTANPSNPHYVSVDGQGELRFADRLEEVPAAYRKDAQRLEK
jgi:hypothetical protein